AVELSGPGGGSVPRGEAAVDAVEVRPGVVGGADGLAADVGHARVGDAGGTRVVQGGGGDQGDDLVLVDQPVHTGVVADAAASVVALPHLDRVPVDAPACVEPVEPGLGPVARAGEGVAADRAGGAGGDV